LNWKTREKDVGIGEEGGRRGVATVHSEEVISALQATTSATRKKKDHKNKICTLPPGMAHPGEDNKTKSMTKGGEIGGGKKE
jgi:hypothetical protein